MGRASTTMKTVGLLFALSLLAVAVFAAPVNEDEWGEETAGTDKALTLVATSAKIGAIPEFFLSQNTPWIRPFAMDHGRKWLSMTDEERDAFAEQHARNAIAAARARGDMVLSDADAELMLPTVKEACKMVGEVLWNNAADIVIGLVGMLMKAALGVDGTEYTAGLAAVTAVTSCATGLVHKTGVPEIDGKKKFKDAKGAMVACTLPAVQQNIQLMIDFFCKTISKPWIDVLIPAVMPTPANAGTWLVWMTAAGKEAITAAVCPALQFGVCAAKAAINGWIKKQKASPLITTIGKVFDGLEIFLCAVAPGNVAGQDKVAATAAGYQAGLDPARALNKFHAATVAKWDATKKEFNCAGKPCEVTCTGNCGPMFGHASRKAGLASGQLAKPGGGL